jgi:integrase
MVHMVLLMSRPQKHPKTGIYRARKVVPADLREAIGKRELVETLGTKDPAVASRLHPEVLIRFDNLLAAARARLEGRTDPVTPREIAEMAGEVYRRQVQQAEAEADPENIESLELGMDMLRGEWAKKPLPHRYREAEALLSERGIVADAATVHRLARAIVDARFHAEDVGLSRARGDWSPEPHGARFPLPSQRPAPAPVAASPTAPLTTEMLLDKFAAENPQNDKTMAKRRAALRQLETSAGHDDAARIAKADVRAMKERRQGAGMSLATIQSEVGTLRPVWSWGLANGLLPEGAANPFTGMTPKTARGAQRSRLPFDDADAVLLLNAARDKKGWLRWLPWVLAFTGARLEEVCGADAADIREVRGVWCLDINSERTGRPLKTLQAQRMVPLHTALIAEGFLAYVQKLPAGSALFPSLPVGSWSRRSSIATKRMGRWLRALGITDPKKVAAHSWRHRMKDTLRFARVPAEAADAILGHDNPTNAGSGYGDGWRGRPDELAVELAKVESPLP